MITKLFWDQTRADRRVAPVVLAVLVLLGVLAHFEAGRAPLDAVFVSVTLLAFVLAVAVLSDLALRVARKAPLGGPFAASSLLLAAYLAVLGLRDPKALLAFLGAALGVSLVLLLYALLRRA
jgi:uncharacterized membrane protein HdeD (DUF308 family)